MNYVVYTCKFGFNGAKHQYTKKIGTEVTQIEFKEYFEVLRLKEKYNVHYAYAYSTFSITEEQHKELTK